MTETAAEADPVRTNPDLYRVILEDDRVRVLEYLDNPGDRTTRHSHPDSVMLTLSSFRRRLQSATWARPGTIPMSPRMSPRAGGSGTQGRCSCREP